MAKATSHRQTIMTYEIVKVEKPVSAVSIHLELSEAEAEILAFVLARIGGDPMKSPRGVTEVIGAALRSVGVQVPDRDDHPVETMLRAIYFLPDPKPDVTWSSKTASID